MKADMVEPNTNDIPEFIVKIARLAGPISDDLTQKIRTDYDLRKRIESSDPIKIVHDLLLKLKVINKPYDPEELADFKAFVDDAVLEHVTLRQTSTDEELAELNLQTSDIVRNGSGLIKAFEQYREGQIEQWGPHYDMRHYETRIQTAEDIGIFVVAQAWKQVEGIE